jgi:RNA polymerase sigma factor (sigma-70 family)
MSKKNRSIEARNELVIATGGLVIYHAQEIYDRIERRVPLDDLISYGYLGLIGAADRFDARSGTKFATFAHKRISGAIIDGIRAETNQRRTYRPELVSLHELRRVENVPG